MAVQTEDQLAGQILVTVDNVSFLSGTALVQIVDNARIRTEQYTGQSIGSTAIAEKYQPAILDLARAEVCQYISLQGGDFADVSIGPFSMKKGASANIVEAGNTFNDMAMQKLRELGRRTGYYRVTGA